MRRVFNKFFLGILHLLFTSQFSFDNLKKKAFKNIVGNGEHGGNQHDSLCPQCEVPYQIQKSSFEQYLPAKFLIKVSIFSPLPTK